MNTNQTASDSPTAAPRLIFAGVQRGGGGIGGFFDHMNDQEDLSFDFPRSNRHEIFINNDNSITILQNRNEDDEAIIVCNPKRARAIASALHALAEVLEAQECFTDNPEAGTPEDQPA